MITADLISRITLFAKVPENERASASVLPIWKFTRRPHFTQDLPARHNSQ